ncbi:hypothetical protein MF271_22630 (plasmid) [Deinococcus sp. KNUC1210]|uniref:hypothetical protein n=1 Tax=Deinococcus sp. KNUC1210 TaxID=2917691 RepID=UPI001EEFD31D|nr:hypothetical protein [Deinococcus sp. KNUC1210]ULH18264.1 hypothetical protein MF271_22630 [Deinococcus sp. KNUC1210]
MTLDQWLQQTLQVFPKSVQRHLGQEYTAHYQDHLDAGGQPDALALFGSPAESQKRLKKTYLTQAMLDRPKRSTGLLGWWMLVNLTYWLSTTLDTLDQPYALTRIAIPVVSLLALVGLWIVTRRLGVSRRSFIRLQGLMFVNSFVVLPGILLTPHTTEVLKWALPLSLLWMLYQAFETDRRIRRTLRPGSARRT